MKQMRILLLLFFLHSKIGVAFNVHYCEGQIAVISSVFDIENCGMEKKAASNEHSGISSMHCCDDDLVVEQNNNDQNKKELEKQTFTASAIKTIQWQSNLFLAKNGSVVRICRPPPRLKIYQKNCAYIFYE